MRIILWTGKAGIKFVKPKFLWSLVPDLCNICYGAVLNFALLDSSDFQT